MKLTGDIWNIEIKIPLNDILWASEELEKVFWNSSDMLIYEFERNRAASMAKWKYKYLHKVDNYPRV